jgi:glycosyl transferase family 25
MIKSYLINLDKDTERLVFFKSNFKKLGMEYERINAVDGRLLPENEYQQFLILRPRHNKSWSRGQMGCFLSHYTVWRKIAEGVHDFCAVFEDDIHISPDLKVILDDSGWIPDNIDIIRLETSTNRVRLSPRAVLTHANRSAYGVKSTSWCAGGYIISRKAAQTLLDLPPREHEPADSILYNFVDSRVATEFSILQFNPALCTQDKHLATGGRFASNIEAPLSSVQILNSSLKKLSLTVIWRALYRSLVGYKRIGFQ